MDHSRSTAREARTRQEPAGWTVLRAAGQLHAVALRFDVAGCAPVELTFSRDALAALYLATRGASESAQWVMLLALLQEHLWPADLAEMVRRGLRKLSAPLISVASDVALAWPIDAHGATYWMHHRQAGRSFGLGSGRSWWPELLRDVPVKTKGGE